MVNQLPQGWKEEELGKLVDIFDNLRKPVSSTERLARIKNKDKSELYPYYGATGLVDYIDGYIFDGEYLLLGEDGCPFLDSLKDKAYIISGKTWVNNHAHVLRAKESKTSNKFLLYYLNKFDYNGIVSGATRLKLNQNSMKKIPVYYPTDKNEQNYIVKTLDAVAEIIRLHKETIQLTKDLIPAIFHEMFGDPITNPKGWEITTLGNSDVCTLQYGYTATAQDSGNTRYIRITDIGKDGYIDNGNKAWLNYDDKMGDYKLYPKDILVARTGASYGKTLLYNNDSDAIFASFLIRIIFNKKKIIPEFYWAYSLTDSYWQQANRLVSGVAQPQFNGSALKQILLMLPPWSLQEEFAKKVEQINKYIVAQQEELEHFETLFQSLLQEAFTGVLTWKYPRKESND